MRLEIRHVSISRKLLILIAVILVVVVAGLLGWFFYQKNFGWVTYSSSKYGYSLRYPKKWVLDAANAEKDFKNGVGGELVISNYKDSLSQLESKNPPSDLMAMKIDIYKVEASTTLAQLAVSKSVFLLQSGASFTKNKVSLGGLEGEQFIYGVPVSQNNVVSVKTVLKRGPDMFVLSFNYLGQNSLKSSGYKLPAAVASVHDAILNSFKLK